MARSGSAALVAQQVNGAPIFLGTIVATTTKNNHDTAVPFQNTTTATVSSPRVAPGTLAGRTLLLQPDADCYVLTGELNTAAVTTANGMRIYSGERVVLTMPNSHGYLAVLAVSGTANLKVWELV